MHFANLPFFLTLLSYVHITRGLGINCRGSSQCSGLFQTTGTTDLLYYFDQSLWYGSDSSLPNGPINDQAVYHSGEHIMCARNSHLGIGSICLFLQGNTPLVGIPGYVIKNKVADLVAHGCRVCGSVPIGPDNDPSTLGILTSNYVRDKSCQGLCSPGSTTDLFVRPSLPLSLVSGLMPTTPAGNQTNATITPTPATTDNPAEAGPTDDPQTRTRPRFSTQKRGLYASPPVLAPTMVVVGDQTIATTFHRAEAGPRDDPLTKTPLAYTTDPGRRRRKGW